MKIPIAIFVSFAYLELILSMGLDSYDAVSPNPKFVTAVDGKSYFAETTIMSWINGEIYCATLGMHLASITTQNQADALDMAHSTIDFHDHHWTSGRDAFLPRQFTWNRTQEAVSTVFPNFVHNSPFPYQTCLLYASFPGNNESYLVYTGCRDNHRVLYETQR